jgi:hypothetical protein
LQSWYRSVGRDWVATLPGVIARNVCMVGRAGVEKIVS